MKVVNLLLVAYSVITFMSALAPSPIVNSAPYFETRRWIDSVKTDYERSTYCKMTELEHRIRMSEIKVSEISLELTDESEVFPAKKDTGMQIFFSGVQ